jgi:hypothetical protein
MFWVITMNIIQNLHQHRISWLDTKIKKSIGANTKKCIANCCKNAIRCRIVIYLNLIEYVCSHTGEKCTTVTEHFTNFYHFVNGLADEGSSRIISTKELNLCRLCVDGTAIRPCKVWTDAFNQMKASKQR